MNRNHRKTLAAVLANPVSGNIEWRRIEALFKAAGCEIIEGSVIPGKMLCGIG
jgi:hypothetical protein